ncbi:MAG TPA: glutamate--tRNA ligase, partial [Chloroflexota bacterium]|nr:glutamate--tRNA ligase [Chloroflexota bacterium]
MTQTVKTRIAPSPTGQPHIGNFRTIVFNWLFTRHHNGKFVVRVEDTDVARKVEGAMEAMLDGLRWLGMDWDEGPEVGGPSAPYLQSQRLPIYKEHAERLIASGHAYYCFCSPRRLAAMREEQQRRKQPPGYDRLCRGLSKEEVDARLKEGITPVVRFAVPLEGSTTFHDLIHGDITFPNSSLDDFVLIKSDGYPTYHMAHLVDDHLMGITHVMRADEWISSTPRHVLLYQAFGWEPPLFAHVPQILGPDKAKLSKRHGATSVITYRDLGYLPEAMLNYLSLLGWAFDATTEVMSRGELIRNFSIEKINKTGAVFDVTKLDWMNGVYIRRLPVPELITRLLPYLQTAGLATERDRPYLEQVVPLIQERMKKLSEAEELMDFFFRDTVYDPKLLVAKGMDAASSLAALRGAVERVSGLAAWDRTALEEAIRPLAEELGIKTGQLFGILRVASTSKTAAPPLFETMEVLGRER